MSDDDSDDIDDIDDIGNKLINRSNSNDNSKVKVRNKVQIQGNSSSSSFVLKEVCLFCDGCLESIKNNDKVRRSSTVANSSSSSKKIHPTWRFIEKCASEFTKILVSEAIIHSKTLQNENIDDDASFSIHDRHIIQALNVSLLFFLFH